MMRPLACPTATFGSAATTYYVAVNEPGADNERCDGLSPVSLGSGRCPFKDFQSQRTFALLRGAAGVRIEVRAGVYTFADEGLNVRGTGTSEGDRIVLTAYQDEAVVFDGRNVLRELIRVSGQYTTVERVTLQNAGAYNLGVSGSDHVIQCNRFLANMASDSLKGAGGARRTVVRYNDFTQWDSQAIDLTDVSDWRIEENDFHDPKSTRGNAIGAKFGARGVLITRNRFYNTRGLSFGGASSPHQNEYEAYNLVAERNTLYNVTGWLVRFYSCLNCAFRDNDARGADGGVVLGGEQDGPSGCAGGCKPTRGAVIARNRFADLRGGVEGSPNTFWWVRSTDADGLSADGNSYCTPSPQDAQFVFESRMMQFTEWTRTVRTDMTSKVGQAGCGG
jgi:hypothetical protein